MRDSYREIHAGLGRVCWPERVSKVKAHLTLAQAVARCIEPEVWQADDKADSLAKEQAATRYDTRDRMSFAETWVKNKATFVAPAKALKRPTGWFAWFHGLDKVPQARQDAEDSPKFSTCC